MSKYMQNEEISWTTKWKRFDRKSKATSDVVKKVGDNLDFIRLTDRS